MKSENHNRTGAETMRTNLIAETVSFLLTNNSTDLRSFAQILTAQEAVVASSMLEDASVLLSRGFSNLQGWWVATTAARGGVDPLLERERAA